MAGLNNVITNKAMQSTTLPAWYDSAQQNIVNQATSTFNAAPTPGETVAQNAVNKLSGTTNPFSTATNTVQNIATGAANPWIVNQQTGKVTPNVNTALGGLFAAQNEQLQQLMPNVQAPVQGANIASGQFGSLRGQTAANKAMADAQAQLAAQQMQAALTNQATGVNAASTAGNLTNQEIKNLLETGQYEQAAPFINLSNLSKIIGSIQAPTTVTNQTQLSPLNQIGGLISLLGGPDGKGGVLKSIGVEGGLGGLMKGISDWLKSSGGSPDYSGWEDALPPGTVVDPWNPNPYPGWNSGPEGQEEEWMTP